jgi:hypothetical protein
MSTQQIPVRSGGPDAVQGMASTEIGAGLQLILHTDEVPGGSKPTLVA